MDIEILQVGLFVKAST